MSINHENQITGAIMLYSYKCIFILKMESPILSIAKIVSAQTSFHFTCSVEVKRSLRFVHYKLTLNTDSFYLSTMVIINKGDFETEWSANWSEVICVISFWLF